MGNVEEASVVMNEHLQRRAYIPAALAQDDEVLDGYDWLICALAQLWLQWPGAADTTAKRVWIWQLDKTSLLSVLVVMDETEQNPLTMTLSQ